MPNVRRTEPKPDAPKTDSVARDTAKTANARRRRERRHTGDTLDFDSINPDTLKRALIAVLKRAVGVTFGVTRDGGALSVTLLDNGETIREYTRATEDVNIYLTGLAEDFETDE